jgi:hypothetical protein
VNIVPSNLQVSRWCLVGALNLLPPPQRLPWRSGAQCGENIHPATAAVVAAKYTGGSTPVLVTVLIARVTRAALPESCGPGL